MIVRHDQDHNMKLNQPKNTRLSTLMTKGTS